MLPCFSRLVLVVGLCACAKKAETTTPTDGSEQTSESAATAQSKGTIGITLPTQELARCLKDQEYLTQYLNERGYDVDVQFAKGDAATQVAQMENMITNGRSRHHLLPVGRLGSDLCCGSGAQCGNSRHCL